MLLKFFLQFFLDTGSFGVFYRPTSSCTTVLSCPQLRVLPCKRAAAHEVAELALESSLWRKTFFFFLLAKLPPPLSSVYSLIANIVSFLHINLNFLRQIKENIQPNVDMEISFNIAFDSTVPLSINMGISV